MTNGAGTLSSALWPCRTSFCKTLESCSTSAESSEAFVQSWLGVCDEADRLATDVDCVDFLRWRDLSKAVRSLGSKVVAQTVQALLNQEGNPALIEALQDAAEFVYWTCPRSARRGMMRGRPVGWWCVFAERARVSPCVRAGRMGSNLSLQVNLSASCIEDPTQMWQLVVCARLHPWPVLAACELLVARSAGAGGRIGASASSASSRDESLMDLSSTVVEEDALGELPAVSDPSRLIVLGRTLDVFEALLPALEDAPASMVHCVVAYCLRLATAPKGKTGRMMLGACVEQSLRVLKELARTRSRESHDALLAFFGGRDSRDALPSARGALLKLAFYNPTDGSLGFLQAWLENPDVTVAPSPPAQFAESEDAAGAERLEHLAPLALQSPRAFAASKLAQRLVDVLKDASQALAPLLLPLNLLIAWSDPERALEIAKALASRARDSDEDSKDSVLPGLALVDAMKTLLALEYDDGLFDDDRAEY